MMPEVCFSTCQAEGTANALYLGRVLFRCNRAGWRVGLLSRRTLRDGNTKSIPFIRNEEKMGTGDEKRGKRQDIHVAHRKYSLQDPLHARLRPTYSIVNKATNVVSKPNQTAFEILRKVGTVSNTVTRADTMINDVINTCIMKAEDEEVGCSRRA